MADITKLPSLQAELNANLMALRTASASKSVVIMDNITNLRRAINHLLFIVNFQLDGKSDRHMMPPPPNSKI